MNQEELEQLRENFESAELMQVMENINKLRAVFGDFNLGPPRIRNEISELHDLAVAVVNNGDREKSEAMLDLAANIEHDVDDVLESLEYVQEVLSKLTAYCAEEKAEDEEDYEYESEADEDDEDESEDVES